MFGGTGHLVDVPGQRAEHEPGADEAADRGAGAPRRGVAPVAPGDPRAQRADEDDRGQAVDELLTGDRDDDALDVAPRRHRLRVRDAPHQHDRAAEQEELAPRREAPTREAEVAGTDQRDQQRRRAAARATSTPGRGTTPAGPTTRCPTSTTTATAQTHSTAGEIGHDAQPVQRQAQPVALACSSVRIGAASACASVCIGHESVGTAAPGATPGTAKTR